MDQQHYAIVATHTLPISKYTHRLLEIYIVRRTTDKVFGTFKSRINPRCIIPDKVSKDTKIDQADVRFEPVFCEVAEAISDILDGAVLVSQRADFDLKVLRSEFRTIGYKFTGPILCTTKLAEKAVLNLDARHLGIIRDYLSIAAGNFASAKEKVSATEKMFLKLISGNCRLEGPETLLSLSDTIRNKAELLNFQTLERKPGVYYFKDDRDTILYIGKAVRLRDRVRSHFYDRSERERSLCSRTSKVDHEYTGSNLIAELLEADEIQRHRPEFNIAQKHKTKPFIIVSSKNKNGYIQLSIFRKDYSDSLNEVFYNRKSVAEKLMEVCTQFNLCPKFCGFHRIRGKCNCSEFTDCPGACVGEEKAEEYNRRVNRAKNYLKEDFKNFAIKTKGRRNGEMGFVLVRNGVYLGFGFIGMDEQIASADHFENYLNPKTHSYHTTRIIDSFIRKPGNRSSTQFFDKIVEGYL